MEINNTQNDELRARFTSWMEITLVRAKSDYMEQLCRAPKHASLDTIPAELIPDPRNCFAEVERSSTDFEFERRN